MRLTIKSRDGEIFRFWMADQGGYVYRETADRNGCTGSQICEGGSFHGDTVRSTPAAFERDCRTWYRQHRRNVENCVW